MYRFNQKIENNLVELDDGFQRYGNKDSPFLLRGGKEKRKEASRFHQERDENERKYDERKHQPITRDLAEWKTDADELDFPHVDTIPHRTLKQRAEEAAELCEATGLVQRIEQDSEISKETVYGQYHSGVNKILLDIADPPFLACRYGPVLAHEVGHAIYDELQPGSGIHPKVDVFDTDEERQEAEKLKRRLNGPSESYHTEGLSNTSEAELFAYVFESICIEPEAAFREAQNAAARVDQLLSLEEFDVRLRTLFDR